MGTFLLGRLPGLLQAGNPKQQRARPEGPSSPIPRAAEPAPPSPLLFAPLHPAGHPF